MRKLLFIIFGLMTSVQAFSQYSKKVDQENGIGIFKLGNHFMDYRPRLTYFGEVMGKKVYNYKLDHDLIISDLTIKDAFLAFDENEHLFKIDLFKFYPVNIPFEVSSADYVRLVKFYIEWYSTKGMYQENSNNGDKTVQLIWYGDTVMFELYYTLYKDPSRATDISLSVAPKNF